MARGKLRSVLGAALLIGAAGAVADEFADADLDIGEEINETCAGCHGEFGQGGKQGEYPRIAGQPAAFIYRQMQLFRARERPNIPMLEFVDERQMPDEEVRDISAYLAQIELATKLPPLKEGEDFDPLERLLEARKVLNIARAPGNVEKGERMYRRECGSCHGSDGEGSVKKAVPMLAGQYTNYLWRQVEKYREGIRIHDPDDPEDRLLKLFTDEELKDIFAWLSIADD